ncbi:PAN/Apple domain [Sesbania bispinosa]|nr:PAN/Apple domain [Sesbania bispinosa]
MGGDIYLVVNDYKANYTVWIGKRDQPIPNTAVAALRLDYSGALQITQTEKLVFLHLPPRHDSKKTVATLLDSGNFVVRQFYSNGSKRLCWQSFDHPIDVLLPGMKLGVNHKAGGKTWSLLSYFLPHTPASGAFTLEWEPEMKQLVIRRKGQIYWASGQLRRDNTFENIPEEAQRMYHYSIHSNEDEDSITFRARNDQYYAPWRLSSEGALLDSFGNEIARADECYGNNNDGGCQRWDVPTCRLYVDKKFETIKATVKPADNLNGVVDPRVSFTTSDCKDACWRNCDCVGFTNLYDNGTGCYFVYGTLVNIHGGSEIFHKLDISILTPSSPINPNAASHENCKSTLLKRLRS